MSFQYHKPSGETPLAHVLKHYLTTKRSWPPINISELARTLNRGRVTVHGWIVRDRMPDLGTQIEVCEQLGILLVDLEQAYEQLHWQVPIGLRRITHPTSEASAPQPKQRRPHRPTETRDEWTVYLDMTEQALRDAHLDDASIANVLAHLEQRRQGIDPWQQRLIEEHTE